MSNRVTLAQLGEMPIQEAIGLPVEQIAMLLDEAAEAKANLKRLDEKLFAILDGRYGDAANVARKASGKDIGTVRFKDDDFTVIADLPKKPQWDQAQLRQAVAVVQSWGDDPAEYVSTEIKVAEKAYTSWPSAIRKVFEPARTLATGKPTYKLERREAA